jgi:hypothetical protein
MAGFLGDPDGEPSTRARMNIGRFGTSRSHGQQASGGVGEAVTFPRGGGIDRPGRGHVVLVGHLKAWVNRELPMKK